MPVEARLMCAENRVSAGVVRSYDVRLCRRRGSGEVGRTAVLVHIPGSKREGTKRGRKPGRKAKSDMKAKLERSRQSARECRARKKLRYQYLEELVANREKAVFALHRELDQYRQWAKDIDEGKIPEGLLKLIEEEKIKKNENE
ncbi:cAMP-responsive element-binding protein-like 2 isoform X1 [Homarus americanus]|uniref:cAMP-responsive element-binding protein-like 2 isoform X1 n=1 Tax=Homarus americanus TaxID=6706 RepID=UPI001C48A848|nr:cAMP-responsive element-binding protein-like 2 isoform X1 [Homarus americanus]